MKLWTAILLLPPVFAQTAEQPVRNVTDPGVITTRQNITPAGVGTVFMGRVYGVAFGASSSEVWALTNGQLFQLDWRANRILSRIAYGGNAGMQGLHYDMASGSPLVSGTHKDARNKSKMAGVRLFSFRNGAAEQIGGELEGSLSGALAVAPKPNGKGERVALVPLVSKNKVAVVDVPGGRAVGMVDTGKAPFAAVVDSEGSVAYVSNWGGRAPSNGDLTAPTGHTEGSDLVVVDSRGIASTGTVSRIDLRTLSVTSTVAVGLHPTAMVWDQQHARLYVANGNDDSVSVIDSNTQRVAQTFAIRPFKQIPHGVAPTALALSGNGATLYVVCGGLNAIAVLDSTTGNIRGTIPTAWYPNGLAVSADGKYLAVSTLLGVGSGARDDPRQRAVQANRGSVHVIPVPNAGQLASYTTSVAENNHIRLAGEWTAAPARKAVAIPARAGDPSLIEHVVYIVKENRTYDQVLGDVAKGNGDPSLVMYGEAVTPNHHRLAEEFVLLDNFYATGGNSGDGHQWLTQANETDYCLWPGYIGRSYPFDGTDPIAYSKNGFIWDAALRMKKTVKVFGEYAGRLNEASNQQRTDLLKRWKAGGDFTKDWNTEAPLRPLNAILARNYPPYSTAIPDVARAQVFLKDLHQWERTGRMPNLVIVQLPSNHTRGTAPGASTPKAMVADNDLALGQIVEALTKTPFWRKMAIFVVEDDAQNGVDHVDGHRTVALAISPYIQRGYVDSTMYSHPSMLKTIELILGLPSLSLFDLIANPMIASFTDEPDYKGYTALTPAQSLFEINPPLKALRGEERKAAQNSMKMRFEAPDAAPSGLLNRILWHNARGWHVPYPGTRRAAFAPVSMELDDEER